jgi:hypothetical protein
VDFSKKLLQQIGAAMSIKLIEWYLGEGLLWIHIPYILAVNLGGVLWIRPLWLWPVHNIAVLALQLACYGCPLVRLACWLQDRQPGPGWVSGLYTEFGPLGPTGGALLLTACGFGIAALLGYLRYRFRGRKWL